MEGLYLSYSFCGWVLQAERQRDVFPTGEAASSELKPKPPCWRLFPDTGVTENCTKLSRDQGELVGFSSELSRIISGMC